MCKLNIDHHKSYHRYQRNNILKVRRDKEEVRLKEIKEEGRMSLAVSTLSFVDAKTKAKTRILKHEYVCYERGCIPYKPSKKKQRDDDNMKAIAAGGSVQPTALPTTKGHINFFEELEHVRSLCSSTYLLNTQKSSRMQLLCYQSHENYFLLC